MGATKNTDNDVIAWITNVIGSCKNIIQLESANRLIYLYRTRLGFERNPNKNQIEKILYVHWYNKFDELCKKTCSQK